MSTVAADGSLLVTFAPSGDTNIHGRWANDGSQRVTVTNTLSSTPLGTTTNDAAAAGYVGEYLTALRAGGSPLSITTATPADVTSLSLTAGDWDVWGMVYFLTGATTVFQYCEASLSATSNTRNVASLYPFTAQSFGVSGIVPGPSGFALNLLPERVSLASTSTRYLVAYSDFTTSTNSVAGWIKARRVR